jgi:undecaprenyl diphosphate synthase
MALPEARAGLPGHIGIIMDGNGRWALSRGLKRTQGHREGLKAAKRIVKSCMERGVPYLSLYVFSTENWKRATEEVDFLMSLIKRHLAAELDFYRENGVRVWHSGDIEGLPKAIRTSIQKTMEDTAGFSRLTVNLCINYGGRDEILRAFGRMATAGASGDIAPFLDNPGLPDVDLMIRTAGEYRISNFLMWQSAYAELYFTDKLWPDFDDGDLALAIESFGKRERRFGGTR